MTCVRMYRHRSRLLSLSSFETLRLGHLPTLIFLALATLLTVLACDGRLECHQLPEAANLGDGAERRYPSRDESSAAGSQWTEGRRRKREADGSGQVKVNDFVEFEGQLSVGGEEKSRDGSQWTEGRRRKREAEGSDQVKVAIDDLGRFEVQLGVGGDGSQWTEGRRRKREADGSGQVKVNDLVEFEGQLSVGGDEKSRDGSQWTEGRRRKREAEGSGQVKVVIDDLGRFEEQLSVGGDGSQWTEGRRRKREADGSGQVKVNDLVEFEGQLSVGGDEKSRDGSQWTEGRRRKREAEGSGQMKVAIGDLGKWRRRNLRQTGDFNRLNTNAIDYFTKSRNLLSVVGDGKDHDGSQWTRRRRRNSRETRNSDQEDTERSEKRMLSATENPNGSNDIADNFANWTDTTNDGETPEQRGVAGISDREEFELNGNVSIGNTRKISERTGKKTTDETSTPRGDKVESQKTNEKKTESHADGCKNGVCKVHSPRDRFPKPETETDREGSEENQKNLSRTVSSTSPSVNVTGDDEYDKDKDDVDEDLEDDDVTFTGFDGSQKFPISIRIQPTQRSPAQQPEKMDRRHFGPPKVDLETSTLLVLTVLPDLPKSPSRDVLPHRRKGNSSDPIDSDRSKEDPENPDRANNVTGDFWLPGMSPGQRTSGSKGSGKNRLTFSTTDSTESDRTPASLSTKDNNEPTYAIVRPTDVALIPKVNITILGLFEMTRNGMARSAGPSELQAARLAVDRINEMNILPWTRLQLIHNDTKCDPGVAVDRFFHALYSKNNGPMPLLLGSMCSEVTETLAKIVPYWNIIQVSFGSTAPALSDSTEFPLFLRTVAPDSSHNVARIALLKHFGWDTVTALSQTGDMYSLAVNDLVTELEQANITCTATITFAENDYKEQLQTLKDLDTRIIIGSFSPRLAPRVFCEAWKLGMHGGDYAWILPGDTIDLTWSVNDWWHSGTEECLPSQLSQTMNGLIIVKSHGAVFGDTVSSSGLTDSMFTAELAKRGVTHSKFAGQTYDAVWAMALALARTEILLNKKNMSVLQYTHTRKDIAYELLDQMRLLQFSGISGPVSFNGADRVGITAFYQMHEHVIRRIGTYTPEEGKLTMNCPGCTATRWPGGHPPAARRVFRLRVVTIAPAAFLAVTCLASIGVTLALAFLAFNLHFRKHKSIKLSSPRLNNMAAVGCVLVYGAVILLGFDHATLPDSDDYYPAVCTARVYLLSAGFSLAFGSMFTKTYRVHRIFTRSRSGVVKNKLLQDTQLISLICVLLLIDGLVVTLWVTLDPMQRHLRNLTLEISAHDRGVVYQPQVEVCRSQHTNEWLGALYLYKGLLLVVGVYMAWETRHVKIPALNDSQYIGMSVYSVVITSGIVVVLANLMSDRATLAFVTITALILASTTATLALLFLPQLANILAGERPDPVIQSLGLKIECNTRRFVTDDKRELQYRVEVQNRVYRREMAQLELELTRLEKQLAQDPVDPSCASSSTSIPQRKPSISGGLPLLLLSVLPPIIPRASWPSADPSGMRRGTVAFSSQPDLEPGSPRRSLADIYKLQQRRETEGPNRLGIFQRLFSLFGSRPTSRKTSTASFTGVASALRVHMGYIAGLVPGTKATSCYQVDSESARLSHPRCGSGPIISITNEDDHRFNLVLRRKESSEPRVNFSLPPQASVGRSLSREKIRGSPRFPHRIIPANSLGAIATNSSTYQPHRWRSMEDARNSKTSSTGTALARNPQTDIWATHEVGIPLSELAHTARGRKQADAEATTVESSVNLNKSAPEDDQRLSMGSNVSNGANDPLELGFKSKLQKETVTTVVLEEVAVKPDGREPVDRDGKDNERKTVHSSGKEIIVRLPSE